METKQELREDFLKNGFDCYLINAPINSTEFDICYQLNNRYEDAYFLTLKRMMHRSKDGVRFNVVVPVLSNYIFAYVHKGTNIDFLKDVQSLFHLKDEIRFDSDYQYARWVLEIDGLLGMSTATLEDGWKINITSGPLLTLQDHIKNYSRRNRNCRVFFDVGDISVDVWLPFEWEDSDYARNILKVNQL